jgi:hypothetical protein
MKGLNMGASPRVAVSFRQGRTPLASRERSASGEATMHWSVRPVKSSPTSRPYGCPPV